MRYVFEPKNVCSRLMILDIEDNVIRHAQVIQGCPGNSLGICRLIVGRTTQEVISLLKGTPCGRKSTSCPDQMAIMLEKINAGEIVPE